MREIKFRAWNGNKMIVYEGGRSVGNPHIGFNGRISCIGESKNWVLMQYTGLKDAKGNEIYEADIVEIDDEFFKIYFNERSAGFQLDRLGMHKASNEFISNVIEKLEVIGNIYENPDISNDFNNGFRCKVKW